MSNLPTFSQFLLEGKTLADFARGKNDRVTTYPKTNTKRFMDDWNSRLGKWVRDNEKSGNHVMKRVSVGDTGEMVLDAINQDGHLISTAVVNGHDDMASGQHTIDFYNQTDVHQHNKYRVTPNETSYEKGWRWHEMSMPGAAHQDTRNIPMSNKDIGNSGRLDDADKGERLLATSPKKGGDWGKVTKAKPKRKT